jgi:hypothetical protein
MQRAYQAINGMKRKKAKEAMQLEPATGGIARTARTTGILGMDRSERDSKGSPSTRALPFFVPTTGPGA